MKKKKFISKSNMSTGILSVNLAPDTKTTLNETGFDTKDAIVLPTRNLVLFPGIALPIQLGRDSSIRAARLAASKGTPLVVLCQINPEIDAPVLDDLYHFGTMARVIDIVDMPDGTRTAIVEGLKRVEITGESAFQNDGILRASITLCAEKKNVLQKQKFDAIINKIRETIEKLAGEFPDDFSSMRMPSIKKIKDPELLVNTLAVHLDFDVDKKQEMLASLSVDSRASILLNELLLKQEQGEIMSEIMGKTRSRMEENQRAAFIQQQIDVLRDELEGDEPDELDILEQRAQEAGFPDLVKRRFDSELKKLRRYNPQSPDYAVQFTYLDTLLSLPFNKTSETNNDFDKAQRTLERDHYGLVKIKERILEQLAVIINNEKAPAPIICFVGPPGTGKTSLGKSIASALGREFERVSLGGLHDEAEIRGHRRTYIGAMPGRIIEAMKRAGTTNPVIMLDELDKIGADYKGDPAAALLEVLDPAQNHKFHDNYVDVDYDLSSVMFIATANTMSTVSAPLRDRIEVIELGGYTTEEKIEIANRHIIPRLTQKNSVDKNDFKIDRKAVRQLIEQYTSEAGVRQLEKALESLIRKKLTQKLRLSSKSTKTEDDKNFNPRVTSLDLNILLGPAKVRREKTQKSPQTGVVNGLAWTAAGGETLITEAALSDGKGVLTLTGNLGDIMKESASLAHQYVKTNAKKLNIDSDILSKKDIHIHFPEGAVPKDGPSAGVTIATAVVSALTGKKVRNDIAMTGEITLHGKVLAIGGVKEKILAAKRAGIKTIILPEDNKVDVEDLEELYTREVNIKYVNDVEQVLETALVK